MQSLKTSFDNYLPPGTTLPQQSHSVLADNLTFGTPAWLPTVARLGLLTAVAVLVLPSFQTLDSPVVRLLLLAGGLLGSVSLLLLLWKRSLTLDLKSRSYDGETGFFPFRRRRSGILPDSARLTLRAKIGRDLYGRPKTLYTLRILLPSTTNALTITPSSITLLRLAPEALVLSLASHVSDRLHVPLERERTVSAKPHAVSSKATLGVLWTVMFGVVAVMLWPILSGSRPLMRQLPPPVNYSANGPRGHDSRYQEHFYTGVDLYQQKKYKEAEASFRELAESSVRDADKADALNMLAYSLAAQKRLAEALKTAQKALSYTQESGNILDTVGEMHELRHEWKEAARYYELALLHLPEDGTTETHGKYGRTLLALHRKREALLHLEEAARAPWGWGPKAREILQQLDAEYKAVPTLGNN